MKIREISVDAFGIWTQLSLQELSHRVTVFVGRNEAGKSTLVQFLRGVLYGYSDDRRRRYLSAVEADRAGGKLRAATRRGEYIISRHVRRDAEQGLTNLSVNGSSTVRENLVVADGRGASVSSGVLGNLLGDVDEATFNNVFAVGLREIQELGSLNDTQAAEHLYRLSGGMDRVSLFDVARRLDAARRELFSTDDSSCRIVELLERRQQLQEEVAQWTAQGSDWLEAAHQRSSVEVEIQQFEENAAAAERTARVLETALQIRDGWLERQQLQKRLKTLGPAPQLPETAMERWQRIDSAFRQRKEQFDQVQADRQKWRQQAQSLPINRRIWSSAAKIEVMAEHAPWIESLSRLLTSLQEQIAALQSQVHAQWKEWGQNGDSRPPVRLTSKNLAALREPARRLRKLARRLEVETRRGEESRRGAQRLTDEVAAALVEMETNDGEEKDSSNTSGPKSGAAPLPNLVAGGERDSQWGSQLRRRVQLEERLQNVDRQQQEMNDRQDEIYGRQVLPLEKLVWIGVPFVLGVMLILSGILGGWLWQMSGEWGWMLVLAGCGGLGVSATWKTWLERSASRELAACHRRMKLLEVHRAETEKERDEVQSRLPPGQQLGDDFTARLAKAEEELEQLEHLLPMDAQRQAAEHQAQAAESNMQKAGRAVGQARKRWQSALAALQLPTSLAPEKLSGLSQRLSENEAIRIRLESLQQELDQRRQEYAAICQRVSDLALHLGLALGADSGHEIDRSKQPESEPENEPGGEPRDGPLWLLEKMTAALAEQKELVQQRRGLLQQYRDLRKDASRLRNSLSKLSRRRRQFLTEANVEDESQLQALVEKAAEFEQLTQRDQELEEEIENVLAGAVSPQSVIGELSGGLASSLDQRWEDLSGRFDSVQNRLSQLRERRGELNQKMKMLAEDRRLGEAKWNLACVEHQLQEAARHWHGLALARSLMKKVHALYEAQRQPEALLEASHFLSALTRGKHQRIWTPFEEDVLYVDDKDGRALSAEWLSRGTREAVYLSLRLALAGSYSRRGVELPLVLDDVLVNLDADRVAAAAEVLTEFAHDHSVQVLLFTCHEHIRTAFEKVGADIRRLSNEPSDDAPAIPETKDEGEPADPQESLQDPSENVEEKTGGELEKAPEKDDVENPQPVAEIDFEKEEPESQSPPKEAKDAAPNSDGRHEHQGGDRYTWEAPATWSSGPPAATVPPPKQTA